MAQLVQLQEELSDEIQEHDANVLVVFREESEGQEGLNKVVEKTNTPFTLALDPDAAATGRYSSGEMVHDSYIIDSQGVIRAILRGRRYDRAQADEFARALAEMAGGEA